MTDKPTEQTIDTAQQRSGFVALIGAPNAGKSTLLNQLLGEKLSIVSRKAQTTRMRVLGLLTEGNAQIGLIDTPGIFQPVKRIDKAMVNAAWASLEGADLVLLIADASRPQPDEKLDHVIQALARRKVKVSLVLNKVDKIRLEKLLPMTARLNETGLFDQIFMISALNGSGVDKLKEHLVECMPFGPWPYPEDQLTDLPERLLCAEITREQILTQLHEELPYEAAVLPEQWENRKDGSIAIAQTIIVTRPNHRAIVLGKGGARIKALGQAARTEMAAQMGCKVHLFLDVRVDERWQDRGEFYTLFGLDSYLK